MVNGRLAWGAWSPALICAAAGTDASARTNAAFDNVFIQIILPQNSRAAN
jgi:hypothetical protein